MFLTYNRERPIDEADEGSVPFGAEMVEENGLFEIALAGA